MADKTDLKKSLDKISYLAGGIIAAVLIAPREELAVSI